VLGRARQVAHRECGILTRVIPRVRGDESRPCCATARARSRIWIICGHRIIKGSNSALHSSSKAMSPYFPTNPGPSSRFQQLPRGPHGPCLALLRLPLPARPWTGTRYQNVEKGAPAARNRERERARARAREIPKTHRKTHRLRTTSYILSVGTSQSSRVE